MKRDIIEWSLKIIKPIVILEWVTILCFSIYGITTYMNHNYWSILISSLFVYIIFQRLKKVITTTPEWIEKELDKKE